MKFTALSLAVAFCIASSPLGVVMVTAFVHPQKRSSHVHKNPLMKSPKLAQKSNFKGPNHVMELNLKKSSGNSSEEDRTNGEHANAKNTSINAVASTSMSTSTQQPKTPIIATNTTHFNPDLESAKQMIVSLTHKIQTHKRRAQQVLTNLFFHDAFGTRGEFFIFAQTFLLYSIFLGHVPLLKNLLQLVFGPLLTLLGMVIFATSIREMNNQGSFTTYATPVGKRGGGRMVMSGLYEYVRHPIYAGSICILVGMSIITKSSMRLLMTAAYGLVVERKARKEEEEMENAFGLEYKEYCKRVPNRFVPKLDHLRRASEVEEKEKEATRVVEHAAAKAAKPRFMYNGNRTVDDSHRGGLFP